MPGITKAQRAEKQKAREHAARTKANRVVEKSRRALKQEDKDKIAQGWWTGLKADVAAAILAGC